MDKGEVYLYSIFLIAFFTTIGGLVYLNETQGKEIRELRQELDAFCVDKGYEEATSRFLKKFAGGEFIQCRKQMGILDVNDKVIEFKTTTDYFFYKGYEKK